MKNIVILGSTGSIGTQALEVVDSLEDVRVVGLSANRNVGLLIQQIRKYSPLCVSVGDEASAHIVRQAAPEVTVLELCELASLSEADIVVTAIVGIAGLLPTIAAINAGKTIALANKETLVTAGDIVMKLAKEKNVRILPVDSEHSAIEQCITGKEINRIILTASGGALFGKTREELKTATVADALGHPNWAMGKKITIDCASMMNKALEVIEAHHLFDISFDKIDVLVHRESIIHSMVEYIDNSVLAQLAAPDMRLPIQRALTYPVRIRAVIPSVNFRTMTFFEPDRETFRLLNIGIQAGREGGTMPVVLNAANEVAVERFLQGKIGFLQIEEIVERAVNNHKVINNPEIGDIIRIDQKVRSEIV